MCIRDSINPIAMLKRVPEWRQACEKYSENYIIEEKHTTNAYQYDRESLTLGAYLSGYCGNLGIRYDDTGWTDENGNSGSGRKYTLGTSIAAHLERFLLSGATVIDLSLIHICPHPLLWLLRQDWSLYAFLLYCV